MRRRRQYVSCLGRQCMADDDEDGGYSRLDTTTNKSGNNIDSESVSMEPRSEADYFRSPNSYQWPSQADNDQGQEPAMDDQGTHNYSGVHVQGQGDKKKPVKKSLPKRIRHFLRVSFKWFRRGLVTVSPAMTSQIMLNPAMVMSTATVARQLQGSKKPLVFL